MTSLHKMLAASAAVIGLGAIGFSNIGVAQSPSLNAIGDLAANEGIFVDGKTFKIAKGKANGDPTAQMAKLGAREVGPGAIVFRYGDKLYIAEGAPQPSPQAMKEFQDQWSVGYMKAQKEFQDQWSVGYMKSFQDQWAVGYMKDPKAAEDYQAAMKSFQDQWNVGYMKAMKEFQDQWSVGYMKSFQDQWNVGYMNAVKNFQDTFTMMK